MRRALVTFAKNEIHAKNCSTKALASFPGKEIKQNETLEHIAQIPIITKRKGGFCRQKGSAKPMVDFTTGHFLGMDENLEVLDARQKALSDCGMKTRMKTFCGSEDIHKDLETLISKMHGMESAALYSGQNKNGCQLVLENISNKDTVLLQDNSYLLDEYILGNSEKQNSITYPDGRLSGLESTLSTTRGRHRFVVVESDFSDLESPNYLRDVCSKAKQHQAMVIYNDNLGLFPMLYMMWKPEYLRILRQPMMIFSSLQLLTGKSSVHYTAGPEKYTRWFDQLTSQSGTKAVPSSMSIITALQNLKNLAHIESKAVRAVANTIQLKRAMKKAGISVEVAEWSLLIPVPTISVASEIKKELADEGYFIGITYKQPCKISKLNMGTNLRPFLQITCSAGHRDIHIRGLGKSLQNIAKKKAMVFANEENNSERKHHSNQSMNLFNNWSL